MGKKKKEEQLKDPFPKDKIIRVRVKKVDPKIANRNGIVFTLLLFVFMAVAGYGYFSDELSGVEEISQTQMLQEFQNEEVESAYQKGNRAYLDLKEEENDVYAILPGEKSLLEVLQDEEIMVSELDVDIKTEEVSEVNWMDIISLLFMGALAVGVYLFVKNMSSSGGKLLDFGQSKARLILGKKSSVGFDDVAGIEESKEELIEVVDFLKNPKKYQKLGARIPKGVLIVGPPGSGKTLLARALAGEADVPFFHTSGSEFEEMLVGAGASRVRDLFNKARKAAPCIVFIDEIDAVAKKRGTTLHSGNTEQTLNQILVEMDGLEPRINVIIVAATNRPDVLDPAILRPGRFDRHIVLTLPDLREREDILKIHAKNKKIDKKVDFKKMARRMVLFSGADIENTLNEAAILAAKNGKTIISEKEIEDASLKVKYGPQRKSKKREEEDLKMVAYHEAGHAIVAYYTPKSDPVRGVSIISRGITGGMTMIVPEKDLENLTRKQMEAEIAILTGGNAAESIAFGDVSTGASSDIREATRTARDMVTKYGMSKNLGFVKYGTPEDTLVIGYGYESKDFSDQTARDIDKEIQTIVQEAWNNAHKILTDNRKELDRLAALLLEKEEIDEKEFKDFFKNKK